MNPYYPEPGVAKVTQPEKYIYGNLTFPYEYGITYMIGAFPYRFVGFQPDQYGQYMPVLELIPQYLQYQPFPGQRPSGQFYYGYQQPSPPAPIQPTYHIPGPGELEQGLQGLSIYEPGPSDEPGDEQPVDVTLQPGTTSFVLEHKWLISKELRLEHLVLFIDPNLPGAMNQLNSHYLAKLMEDSNLQSEMAEFKRKQPLAFLCEVQSADGQVGHHFAVAYDRTKEGYVFTSRLLSEQNFLPIGQTVLCVDGNGTATPRHSYDWTRYDQSIDVRVLLVAKGGYLVYFAPDRPYILTYGQYLVFTNERSVITFSRIFDTKREDASEVFLKKTILSSGPPVDGMVIYQAVVQRDTGKDGTYAVTGNGNAIVPISQIQDMLSTDPQNPNKQYYKRESPPSSRSSSPSIRRSPSPRRPSSRASIRSQSPGFDSEFPPLS